MEIISAKELFIETDFSNDNTVSNFYYSCKNCGEKIGFTFKNLEKHRFSKFSNIEGKEKEKVDKLILSMIPKYKLKLKRQIWTLSKMDRFIVRIQRIYLRVKGLRMRFLPIPRINENIPDSYLDYKCQNCKKPIRIYYFSYIGGKHCEYGFVLKYVLN